MTQSYQNILVIQTAFIGDAVLTLPLVQSLKKSIPASAIDVVVVPRAAELFHNHPAISEVIAYDKRGKDKGIAGFWRIKARLRRKQYQLAVVPHRSMRSALLAKLSNIPERIGFDKSTGRILFTKVVPYRSNLHEIERNLSLLESINMTAGSRELPALYPTAEDGVFVDRVLSGFGVKHPANLVGLAPGTIWNTKRWLPERFAELSARLIQEGFEVLLIGGKEDEEFCERIKTNAHNKKIYNAAGKFGLLQSAEAIRRCRVLVSNDSAPMHFAVAVRTPVIGIFGATVPEFGFSPYGELDVVLETKGLACRPCSIHGGHRCPITTFDCMMAISSDQVFRTVQSLVDKLTTKTV